MNKLSVVALLGCLASAQEWESIAASAESLGNSYASVYATSDVAGPYTSAANSIASVYTASTASASSAAAGKSFLTPLQSPVIRHTYL